jgi:hypothetical protein
MKNPFLDFKNVSVPNRDLPLERMVEKHRQMMEELLAVYLSFDADHIKEFCRLLTHGLNFNRYKTFLSSLEMPKFLASALTIASTLYEYSLRSIQSIKVVQGHIEEFCAFMGLSKTAAFEQSAPLGLFISALINASKERRFELKLHNYPNSFHFLGYRLKEEKHLSVTGDLGHFTGAGLRGGYLKVTGSTGSWCGADMIGGRIKVTGDAHSKIGEQMKGGQIQVYGRIQEIAKYRCGGDIQSKYGKSGHPG